MGRLFISRHQIVALSVSAGCLAASPALAEVCDKVLGEAAPLWLMHAPLWIYVVREFFSVVTLILLGIAILNLFEPGMRWLTLAAAIVSMPIAWISVQENLSPHPILDAARGEGCGGSYLAGAIVSPIATAILLASFFYVTLRKRNS
ncbi:hypothetical protein [Microvirga puerhi]|uniref:Disulfide bond formation protein B n=1 Tax=Microvirga puerhi TaxID=2876078 RepID=A0ABS7VQX5_9HYPH|nr:hypothetical protein [Microvirga puerhi]MBZ6077515.1 hypothetical protein [Microvirga puerhi]